MATRRPTTEQIIREANQEGGSAERTDDGIAPTISVGDTSLRAREVDHTGGGASRLGKGALGSASLQAALTLHPCIHISGIGDASEEVIKMMMQAVGPCAVCLLLDEDGETTGEAPHDHTPAPAYA